MPQIAQHGHCQICGKAVEWGSPTCGKECQDKLDDLQRRRKRTVRTMYILIAVSMGIMVLSLLGYLPG